MRTGTGEPGDVAMVHHLCGVCGMSATCVLTATANRAWDDHMGTHDTPQLFESWTWWVVPIDFDASGSGV